LWAEGTCESPILEPVTVIVVLARYNHDDNMLLGTQLE
jgi:hypothetical protein